MTFVKGKSGNPGGRPAIAADVKELAREHTTAAIEKYVYLLNNAEDQRTQLAAATALLERAYGKPAQALEHSGGMTVNVNLYTKTK